MSPGGHPLRRPRRSPPPLALFSRFSGRFWRPVASGRAAKGASGAPAPHTRVHAPATRQGHACALPLRCTCVCPRVPHTCAQPVASCAHACAMVQRWPRGRVPPPRVWRVCVGDAVPLGWYCSHGTYSGIYSGSYSRIYSGSHSGSYSGTCSSSSCPLQARASPWWPLVHLSHPLWPVSSMAAVPAGRVAHRVPRVSLVCPRVPQVRRARRSAECHITYVCGGHGWNTGGTWGVGGAPHACASAVHTWQPLPPCAQHVCPPSPLLCQVCNTRVQRARAPCDTRGASGG